jgi:hypothetical protein
MTDASSKRLFTDTYMHNSAMRDEIEEFYDCLQRVIHNNQLSIPSKNYDLVLDISVKDDKQICWSYYYACHEARCLFWLETYDIGPNDMRSTETLGLNLKSPAHISVLHLSRSEFPTAFTNVVYRALFGGLLLVGLPSRTGLVW